MLKLALITLMILLGSCSEDSDKSSSSLSLVSFTASAGPNTETQINLSAALPSSTAGFGSVKIYRLQGSSAPSCGSGTLVQNFTNFVTSPLTATDSGLTAETSYAYRACVYDTGDNLKSSLTLVRATLGACLVGETLISTPEGERRLMDLKVGESVLTFDHGTGAIVAKKILAWKSYGVMKVGMYKAGGQLITGVAAHRFYDSLSEKYLSLGELVKRKGPERVSMQALDRDKQITFSTVDSSVEKIRESEAEVYDIRVEGENNFFANGVLTQGY